MEIKMLDSNGKEIKNFTTLHIETNLQDALAHLVSYKTNKKNTQFMQLLYLKSIRKSLYQALKVTKEEIKIVTVKGKR